MDMNDVLLDDVLGQISSEEIVDIASNLIRIPSIRGSSESGVAEWLAAFLGDAGYEVHVQEVLPGRSQVVAFLRGARPGARPRLMLNGHLDIDPLRGDWLRDPWSPVVEGDLLYGAGARNMKGGVAAMVMAAEAVRRSNATLEQDLVLACVMGELEGGLGTAHLLRSGIAADMVILPEPLGADSIVTAMPGVTELALTTVGFSEHVSRKYLPKDIGGSAPIDAIEHMEMALRELRSMHLPGSPSELFPDLPFLHVGCVIGGRGSNYDLRGTNYVSDRCTAVLHICYTPDQNPTSIRQAVAERLTLMASENPGFQWELAGEAPEEFGCRLVSVPPAIVPRDEEVVEVVRRNYRVSTGREVVTDSVVLPQCYTAGDTAHLWQAGIPSVYYGPASPPRLMGDSDDCVSIAQMRLVADVLARSVIDVCL